MSCHGCAINFSLFVKEQTCPCCKFSFCTKCLKRRLDIDEVSEKICNNCYKKLANQTSPSGQNLDPPALLLKRLETLENPVKPPMTIFKGKKNLLNLSAGLGPKDKHILERLEKLKEDHRIQSPPSETELQRRLMKLRGLNEENLNEKPQLIQHPRSDQEEVDDLMKQYMHEVILEGKTSEEMNRSVEDIAKRVQKLHTTEYKGMQKSFSSASEADDGDFISKNIIEKAIAEAKLKKKLEESGLMSDDDDDDGGEEYKIGMDFEGELALQWCIICNEDASLKCLGCDGSLYCNTCFKQGHEFFDMEDHETIKIVNEEA